MLLLKQKVNFRVDPFNIRKRTKFFVFRLHLIRLKVQTIALLLRFRMTRIRKYSFIRNTVLWHKALSS